MKKQTQREKNPYKNSDSNKRYQTFDYYMKTRFGGKCAKISLDAGFSCPNIDGTVGYGGCIYCSGGSSGALGTGALREQYDAGVAAIASKWAVSRFVPYLQAHTNTYAPIDELRRIYGEAASFPGAVMLAIATRADCLSDEVIALLVETSKKIPLLVELGLQSVHDATAEIINRGHTYGQFLWGYNRLRDAGGDISITVHLINGLPGESTEMMLESARVLSALRPHMVKLHLLHILRDTPLERMYESGEYTTMERDGYIDTVVRQIELFHPDTVIARITGDAPGDSLVAPEWCRKKTAVANDIDKEMFVRDTYQGRCFH
ncbi:MAG: TIGR01212 family radical SAM protein [Ruminococcaceae bacterium]|nr:TIGR01212 family radical SAM protein [Oscillospiraceae bacterium]